MEPDINSHTSRIHRNETSPAVALGDETFVSFVGECNRIVEKDQAEPKLLKAIRDVTEKFVSGWRMLDSRYLKCCPDSPYGSYLLYVNAKETLSVVLDVFMPGQAAVIHNHRCWCAFTCLDGMERERIYEVPADLSAAPDQVEERLCPVNNVRVLGSDRHLFHQVECASTDPAVSLHLYGADIGRLQRDLWDEGAGTDGQFVTFRSEYTNDASDLPVYYRGENA